MSLITFYDAASPSAIAALAKTRSVVAAATYCDAKFAADFAQLCHDMPALSNEQRIASIGTRSGTVCRIFDKEPGNPLDAAQTAANVVAMFHRGIYLPGAYADGSDMPSVRAALKATGLPRSSYALWLADPTGKAPTEQWLIDNDFDAVQYGWASLGQAPAGTDVNVARAHFFPAINPPKPKPTTNSGIAKAEVHVDLVKHRLTVHGIAGENVVFAGAKQELKFHGGIGIGAGGGNWTIHFDDIVARRAKPKPK